jgi:hypothetical protein
MGRKELEPLRKSYKKQSALRNKILKSYRKANKYYKKVRSAGCAKTKTSIKKSSGGKSYYKWSWSWWLRSNRCSRYTKAIASYNKELKSIRKLKKEYSKLYKVYVKAYKNHKKLNSKKIVNKAAFNKYNASKKKFLDFKKTYNVEVKTYKKAKAEVKAAKKWCYSKYRSSSYYTKWRSYRYKSSRTTTRTKTTTT